MTITTNDVTVQGVDTVVPAFTIPAASLRDMLAGALVAVGKDKTLPTLTALRVAWEESPVPVVTVASTDRYRLAVGEWSLSDRDQASHVDGDGAVLMPADMAASLVKALPKASGRPGWERATLTVSDGVITVTWPGDSATGVAVEGDFPKWRTLIPSEDQSEGTVNIAFDPKYLSDVVKIPHGKNDPVKWTFRGATRPAVARFDVHNEVTWTYLLMPRRLP